MDPGSTGLISMSHKRALFNKCWIDSASAADAASTSKIGDSSGDTKTKSSKSASVMPWRTKLVFNRFP